MLPQVWHVLLGQARFHFLALVLGAVWLVACCGLDVAHVLWLPELPGCACVSAYVAGCGGGALVLVALGQPASFVPIKTRLVVSFVLRLLLDMHVAHLLTYMWR
jgi:hypothetical protein